MTTLEDNLYHLYLYTYSCARQKPEADYFISPQNSNEEMAAIAFGVRDAKLTDIIQKRHDLLESIKNLFRVDMTPTVGEIATAKTHKIMAIKMYRERTGVGLKEAKDAIDAIVPPQSVTQLQSSPSPYTTVQAAYASLVKPSKSLPDLNQDEIDLIEDSQKIQAIKHYNQRMFVLGETCGLADAKQKVDDYSLNVFHSTKIVTNTYAPTQEEIDLWCDGDKITAIKKMRERLSCGLLEAKNALEHEGRWRQNGGD